MESSEVVYSMEKLQAAHDYDASFDLRFCLRHEYPSQAHSPQITSEISTLYSNLASCSVETWTSGY